MKMIETSDKTKIKPRVGQSVFSAMRDGRESSAY